MEEKKGISKWIWVGAVIVVVVLILIGSTKKPAGDFTIGAVLPLTGAASVWGENVKNGMELALKDKSGLKILYDDSKGTPADGISAFERLQLQRVDLSVTGFSAVSVALSKVALERKLPLIATIATADGIANDYAIRYYNNATIYAEPAFVSPISPVLSSKKIALLYRNDDFGLSVAKKQREFAQKYGKEIVFDESFNPNEKDFTTLLTKVKFSEAEVLIFSDAVSVEGIGIVKTAKQLGLKASLIESSAQFNDLNSRKQVEGITFYSTVFDFVLPDKATEFKEKYKVVYGKEPNFGAAFGYDLVNFISECKKDKANLQTCLRGIKQYKGISGVANQVAPGDFVVTMGLEKVN